MRLREDGSVKYRGEVISFDNFTRMLRNFDNVELIYYECLKWMGITISDFYVTLYLDGIPNNREDYKYVEEIIKIYEEYSEYKRQKKIIDDALNEGVIPKDDSDKELVINYLNNQITRAESNIELTKKNRVKSIIFSLTGCTLLGGGIFALTGADVSTLPIYSMLPIGGIGLSFVFNHECKYEIGILKGKLDDYHELLNRVKGIKANNPVEKEIKENEYDDKLKVKEYNDIFINEVARVIALMNQLPSNVRDEYRVSIDEILTNYKDKVKIILTDESTDIILGKARDVYSLGMELLPELYKIERAILFRLERKKQIDSINEKVIDLKDQLYSSEEEQIRKVA